MKYLLYLPKDYDQKESWPLLVFLHGAGERGDNLDLVKKHGPPKLIEAGKQFPFIVLSPQCPDGQWWDTFTLTALLDEITREVHGRSGPHLLDRPEHGRLWNLGSGLPNAQSVRRHRAHLWRRRPIPGKANRPHPCLGLPRRQRPDRAD